MVEERGVPVFRPSEKKAAEAFEKRTGRKPIIVKRRASGFGVSIHKGDIKKILAEQEAKKKADATKLAREKVAQELKQRVAEQKARELSIEKKAIERRNLIIKARRRERRERITIRELPPRKITTPKISPIKFVERPPSVVEEFKPKFETKREKSLFNIRREQERLNIKRGREGLTKSEERKLLLLETQAQGLEILLIPKELIGLGKAIKKDPVGTLKAIPKSLKQEAVKEVQIIKTDPQTGFIKVGAGIFFWVASGKFIKVLGKLGSKGSAIINPKFAKVKKGVVEIPSGQVGKKTINIEIVEPGIKKIKIPLKEQLKLVGKKIPVVTSAQADKLITILKSQKIIRKPIPDEIKLSKLSKSLLKSY